MLQEAISRCLLCPEKPDSSNGSFLAWVFQPPAAPFPSHSGFARKKVKKIFCWSIFLGTYAVLRSIPPFPRSLPSNPNSFAYSPLFQKKLILFVLVTGFFWLCLQCTNGGFSVACVFCMFYHQRCLNLPMQPALGFTSGPQGQILISRFIIILFGVSCLTKSPFSGVFIFYYFRWKDRNTPVSSAGLKSNEMHFQLTVNMMVPMPRLDISLNDVNFHPCFFFGVCWQWRVLEFSIRKPSHLAWACGDKGKKKKGQLLTLSSKVLVVTRLSLLVPWLVNAQKGATGWSNGI